MNAAVNAAITAATSAAAAARTAGLPVSDVSAYEGPADGDYVAYLEAIERRQLVQLGHAQAMTDTTPRGTTARATPMAAKALTTAERDAIRSRLATARSASGIAAIGTGQWVVAAIGAVFVLLSMAAGGGLFMFLVGVALLWLPLKGLRRLLRGGGAVQRAQMDKLFSDRT